MEMNKEIKQTTSIKIEEAEDNKEKEKEKAEKEKILKEVSFTQQLNYLLNCDLEDLDKINDSNEKIIKRDNVNHKNDDDIDDFYDDDLDDDFEDELDDPEEEIKTYIIIREIELENIIEKVDIISDALKDKEKELKKIEESLKKDKTKKKEIASKPKDILTPIEIDTIQNLIADIFEKEEKVEELQNVIKEDNKKLELTNNYIEAKEKTIKKLKNKLNEIIN